MQLKNSKTGKAREYNLQELFEKYNEINYINLYLESDEKAIEDELECHGIFEDSKIYKNRQLTK